MLLWVAQAISQTAQHAIWYAIMVLVQAKSHSATQMSLAVMTLIVPSVLFGIIAGAYVDRWDKRVILVGTNALRAVVTLGYVAFADLLPLIFVVNFLFATIGQFFLPAEGAMIPTLVHRRALIQANSLFHLTFTASQLVGIVLLGPVFVTLFGLNALFVMVSVLLLVCAALCWPLPSGPGARVVQAGQPRSFGGLWADVREALGYMRADRVVRLAVGHWTLGAMLTIMVATLAPNFAEFVVGIRAEDSVFVLAPAGVGMVLGSMLLTRFGQGLNRQWLIATGLVVVALALIVLGCLRPVANWLMRAREGGFELPADAANAGVIATVMVTALVAGVGFVAIIVASQTIIQERVPVNVRGRVFAVQFMLSNLVSLGPLVFLAGVADLIGVGRTLVLLGLAVLVVWVLTIRAHGKLAASEPRA
jgi:MFS family permease